MCGDLNALTNVTSGVNFKLPEDLKLKSEMICIQQESNLQDLLSNESSNVLLSLFTMAGKTTKHIISGAINLDKEEFAKAFGKFPTNEQPISKTTDNEDTLTFKEKAKAFAKGVVSPIVKTAKATTHVVSGVILCDKEEFAKVADELK